MKRRTFNVIATMLILCSILWNNPIVSYATDVSVDPRFDAQYYADAYPDVKEAFGYDVDALWNHYVTAGQYESRKCYEGDVGGTIIVDSNGKTLNITDLDRMMFERVNDFRVENGVEPLEWKAGALAVSQVRIAEIPIYFSHSRPDGTDFATTYYQLNVYTRRAGENIAYRGISRNINTIEGRTACVDAIFNQYLNSPGHRQNMLETKWKYFGSAFVFTNGRCYQVQTFTTD